MHSSMGDTVGGGLWRSERQQSFMWLHTSLAITDDNGILDFTEGGETTTKGLVGGVPGQATDEQLGRPEK